MAQQVNTAPDRAALAVDLGVSWDDGLVAGRRTVARARAPSPVFATRAVPRRLCACGEACYAAAATVPPVAGGGEVPVLLTSPRRTREYGPILSGSTRSFGPAVRQSLCPSRRPGVPRRPRRRRGSAPIASAAARRATVVEPSPAAPQKPCLAPVHAACGGGLGSPRQSALTAPARMGPPRSQGAR